MPDRDSYPAQVRRSLEASRATGDVGWFGAWAIASEIPCPDEWLPLRAFMADHFRAAYDRDDSVRGRLTISAPDAHAMLARPASSRRTVQRCASGDGCDRLATRGRFGPLWCEHHGVELERLRLAHGEGQETGRAAA